MFVDESGLSERPHRVRTWSPRGQTPVLQYSFNWQGLSALAGITIWHFYFRLFLGSIKAPQVIQFLEHLQRHIGGRLTIIWDGLPAHRSRLVRAFVAGQRGRSHWSFCRPMRRNSIRWNTSGVTVSSMNCPISARKTLAN